jgi:hypothetical protein
MLKALHLSRAVMLASALLFGASPSGAAAAERARPPIAALGQSFADWGDYFFSDAFVRDGLRCGHRPATQSAAREQLGTSDCGASSTNPAGAYLPGAVYEIPVVVHVIRHSNGSGYLSDSMIASQIAILNEDFGALANTPGGSGVNGGIRFKLATKTPYGYSTNGITRSVNDAWYYDSGDPLCQRQQRIATAAADVEHVLAGAQRKALHRGQPKGPDHAIERLLMGDPALPTGAVPVRVLLLVVGHGG